MRVLFLTPWYPSKKDEMSGLFVQKHVEAVRAQGVEVRVIFSQSWGDMWRQWRTLRREGWMPDVVQLNVIQKQGILVLWLKKRYGIPYVIVEHWTGYLPENRLVQPHRLHTRFMKLICRNAEAVMPVSHHLGKAMQDLGFTCQRWEKINNVVDDFFYKNSEVRSQKSEKKNLLHISCVDEAHKNIKGILRAVKTISKERQDFELSLVGISIDHEEVKAYGESLQLPSGMIHWCGELTPQQVSEAFDQADIFVLNSNYENAPVVICESIVKGVPIVSTNVGGIPEMMDQNCGILIEPDNDEQLTEALRTMLDHYPDYDRNTIRRLGNQYSFAHVGKQLKEIYDSCLHRDI